MKTTKCTLAMLALIGAGSALADDYVDSEDQSLRFREAGFYGQTASGKGVDVGIDRLNRDDQVRVFGSRISGYVPYNVAVTNNSAVRVYINDFKLLDNASGRTTQPRDLEQVLNESGSYFGNKGHLRMSILRGNLISKSLQSVIVAPGETVQGVVFADDMRLGETGGSLQMRLQRLDRLAFVEITVPFRR